MNRFGDEFSPVTELPSAHLSESIKFLQTFRPAGPWVLTSIVPDHGTTTATFAAADWARCLAWLELRKESENVYFQVNSVFRPLTKKSSKEDISRMDWLHVDLDPRSLSDVSDVIHAREHFEEERVRILGLLEKYPRKPTLIVDSGGGFQAFWKLSASAKLETNGDPQRVIELEQYNVQLSRELGGDHCHNIDRIMRLPGTVNLPNEKKRRLGRVPALAKVVRWEEIVYPIEQFLPAAQKQVAYHDGTLVSGSPRVHIANGNVPDIGVDELRAWMAESGNKISDHCLAVIATGADPVNPGKYSSRSEALFGVVCELLRAGLPDEMVYSVITGTNEIAASIKDKPDPDRYAMRQIERGKEEIIDPMLRQLNEVHAVIGDIGGKCRIISEVKDPNMDSQRVRISKQSFADFLNRYRNRKVRVGTGPEGQAIMKSAGTWWIDHPQRRQYDTMCFAPGKEIQGAYNLWKGFTVNALPGDKHESYLLHIFNNLCGANNEYYDYLLSWMARAVQQPDCPGEVAVVIRGKKGTGKSFFANVFGRLWGRHFLQISNSKHLVGNFNAHLRDAVVVFGDEAFFAGDRVHESVLKTLITEETLVVEAKGIDVELSNNFTHLILASNADWVVPAGLEERRFFCLEAGDANKQDHAYFEAINNDLDDGGLENLLHFLMSRDIRQYNVRKVPQTEALLSQKLQSMDPDTEWFYNLLQEGRLLQRDTQWTAKVVSDSLYQEYLNHMNRMRKNYMLNPTTFGRFITNLFPPNSLRRARESVVTTALGDGGFPVNVTKRMHVYYLPPLEDVRAHWDKNFGGPYKWTDAEVQLPITQDNQSPF